MSVILHTERLSIGYPSNKENTLVAENIRVTLNLGKLTGLIGSNGTGKSTLLRTLSGVQPPLSGSVILDGQPLTSYDAASLAVKRSLVLTERLPASDLTVFELVALGRQPYTDWLGRLSDRDRRKTEEALHLTGTSHLSAKRHHEISDGQLQNVLIARAIAQDTPIILLDEPATHLDLPHKMALLRMLKSLAHVSGKAILFSTHDVEQALQLCDDLILVVSGETIQDTPEKLISDRQIDRLFDDPGIRFDPQKRQFIFNGT